ncbi:hypothetical protein BsWGS_23617 [Bradybaena similaris]
MIPRFASLILAVLVSFDLSSQHPPSAVKKGYELQFQSVPEELDNVPMNFTGRAPAWLKGALVRAGPALFELGSESTVTSTLDGFAKVARWSFQGNNILFSTKFIKSTYYNESLAKNKFTSNIFFSPPLPRLTPAEVQRSQEVGIDNMDINIVQVKDYQTNKVHHVATNDILSVYELSLDDLSTVQKVEFPLSHKPRGESPKFLKELSTSHPLPEPNTGNLINVVLEAGVTSQEANNLRVVRIKSLDLVEDIVRFAIPEVPLLHSFGVSPTKVVILMNPYILNATCRMQIDEDCYKWKDGNDPSTLYVVDILTGRVENYQIPKTFVYHHINSFDDEDTVKVDVAAYSSPIPHTKFHLPTLRDEAARNQIDPRADLKRITINLGNGTASINSLDSPTPISSLANTLDYPVINEKYRSKKYCYAYGLIEKIDSFNIETVAVAKKDLCKNDGRNADAIYTLDGWYPSEPTFVPTPGATSEDDGVVLVPFTSGDTNRTNLVLLNGEDLKLIDMAEGPILIPQSQHGRYLDL